MCIHCSVHSYESWSFDPDCKAQDVVLHSFTCRWYMCVTPSLMKHETLVVFPDLLTFIGNIR